MHTTHREGGSAVSWLGTWSLEAGYMHSNPVSAPTIGVMLGKHFCFFFYKMRIITNF